MVPSTPIHPDPAVDVRPGSGIIEVNSIGGRSLSGSILDIAFSAKNDPLDNYFGMDKLPQILAGQHSLYDPISGFNKNGYLIQMDSTIGSNPAAVACIKKAMNDWACVTGVFWQLDTSVYTSFSISDDNSNLIGLHSLPAVGYSSIASTFSHIHSCGAAQPTPFNNQVLRWENGADIAISDDI